MYRKKDLQFLQDIFDRPSNDIALLYGRRNAGLSEIVTDLIRDKECLYYRAVAVDDKTQRQLFALSLHEQTKTPVFSEEDYGRLIVSYVSEHTDRKKIIVLDDFSYLVKEDPTFINFLTSILFNRCKPGTAMILLVCDDIRWIENDMLRLIGKKSSEIAGVIKMNDFTPTEFRDVYKNMPLSEVIGIYSFLGGKCAYYDDITDDTTLRDVVIKQLNEWMRPGFDRDSYLPSDIREPAVYNTILVNIASGKDKLGELHDVTGIDRSKLSVYLKKLIESGLAEKVINADVGNASDTRKGVYRMSDSLVRFYYRYVFPRASTLTVSGADRFYRRYIEHDISGFFEETYAMFCMEHIRWLGREGRLNFKVSSVEEFHDKNRVIDFVIIAAGGSVIACSCRYMQHMTYKIYEDIQACVRRNKLPCDNIWLFCAGGFDQKLTGLEESTPGLKLIEGKDQRLR